MPIQRQCNGSSEHANNEKNELSVAERAVTPIPRFYDLYLDEAASVSYERLMPSANPSQYLKSLYAFQVLDSQ